MVGMVASKTSSTYLDHLSSMSSHGMSSVLQVFDTFFSADTFVPILYPEMSKSLEDGVNFRYNSEKVSLSECTCIGIRYLVDLHLSDIPQT